MSHPPSDYYGQSSSFGSGSGDDAIHRGHRAPMRPDSAASSRSVSGRVSPPPVSFDHTPLAHIYGERPDTPPHPSRPPLSPSKPPMHLQNYDRSSGSSRGIPVTMAPTVPGRAPMVGAYPPPSAGASGISSTGETTPPMAYDPSHVEGHGIAAPNAVAAAADPSAGSISSHGHSSHTTSHSGGHHPYLTSGMLHDPRDPYASYYPAPNSGLREDPSSSHLGLHHAPLSHHPSHYYNPASSMDIRGHPAPSHEAQAYASYIGADSQSRSMSGSKTPDLYGAHHHPHNPLYYQQPMHPRMSPSGAAGGSITGSGPGTGGSGGSSNSNIGFSPYSPEWQPPTAMVPGPAMTGISMSPGQSGHGLPYDPSVSHGPRLSPDLGIAAAPAVPPPMGTSASSLRIPSASAAGVTADPSVASAMGSSSSSSKMVSDAPPSGSGGISISGITGVGTSAGATYKAPRTSSFKPDPSASLGGGRYQKSRADLDRNWRRSGSGSQLNDRDSGVSGSVGGSGSAVPISMLGRKASKFLPREQRAELARMEAAHKAAEKERAERMEQESKQAQSSSSRLEIEETTVVHLDSVAGSGASTSTSSASSSSHGPYTSVTPQSVGSFGSRSAMVIEAGISGPRHVIHQRNGDDDSTSSSSEEMSGSSSPVPRRVEHREYLESRPAVDFLNEEQPRMVSNSHSRLPPTKCQTPKSLSEGSESSSSQRQDYGSYESATAAPTVGSKPVPPPSRPAPQKMTAPVSVPSEMVRQTQSPTRRAPLVPPMQPKSQNQRGTPERKPPMSKSKASKPKRPVAPPAGPKWKRKDEESSPIVPHPLKPPSHAKRTRPPISSGSSTAVSEMGDDEVAMPHATHMDGLSMVQSGREDHVLQLENDDDNEEDDESGSSVDQSRMVAMMHPPLDDDEQQQQPPPSAMMVVSDEQDVSVAEKMVDIRLKRLKYDRLPLKGDIIAIRRENAAGFAPRSGLVSAAESAEDLLSEADTARVLHVQTNGIITVQYIDWEDSNRNGFIENVDLFGVKSGGGSRSGGSGGSGKSRGKRGRDSGMSSMTSSVTMFEIVESMFSENVDFVPMPRVGDIIEIKWSDNTVDTVEVTDTSAVKITDQSDERLYDLIDEDNNDGQESGLNHYRKWEILKVDIQYKTGNLPGQPPDIDTLDFHPCNDPENQILSWATIETMPPHLLVDETIYKETVESSMCLICCDTLADFPFQAITPCGHDSICGKCALRSRWFDHPQWKNNDASGMTSAKHFPHCPVCKEQWDFIGIVRAGNPSISWSSLFDWPLELDEEIRVWFQDLHTLSYFRHLRSLYCSICVAEQQRDQQHGSNDQEDSKHGSNNNNNNNSNSKKRSNTNSGMKIFNSIGKLMGHIKYDHKPKTMCRLCLEHMHLFMDEQRVFNSFEELKKHDRYGSTMNEELNLPKTDPHPFCSLCTRRFYNKEQLYKHCEKDHFSCHRCAMLGTGAAKKGQLEYYEKKEGMIEHLRREHILCEHPTCLGDDNSLAVFDDVFEFEQHELSFHGRIGAGAPHSGSKRSRMSGSHRSGGASSGKGSAMSSSVGALVSSKDGRAVRVGFEYGDEDLEVYASGHQADRDEFDEEHFGRSMVITLEGAEMIDRTVEESQRLQREWKEQMHRSHLKHFGDFNRDLQRREYDRRIGLQPIPDACPESEYDSRNASTLNKITEVLISQKNLAIFNRLASSVIQKKISPATYFAQYKALFGPLCAQRVWQEILLTMLSLLDDYTLRRQIYDEYKTFKVTGKTSVELHRIEVAQRKQALRMKQPSMAKLLKTGSVTGGSAVGSSAGVSGGGGPPTMKKRPQLQNVAQPKYQRQQPKIRPPSDPASQAPTLGARKAKALAKGPPPKMKGHWTGQAKPGYSDSQAFPAFQPSPKVDAVPAPDLRAAQAGGAASVSATIPVMRPSKKTDSMRQPQQKQQSQKKKKSEPSTAMTASKSKKPAEKPVPQPPAAAVTVPPIASKKKKDSKKEKKKPKQPSILDQIADEAATTQSSTSKSSSKVSKKSKKSKTRLIATHGLFSDVTPAAPTSSSIPPHAVRAVAPPGLSARVMPPSMMAQAFPGQMRSGGPPMTMPAGQRPGQMPMSTMMNPARMQQQMQQQRRRRHATAVVATSQVRRVPASSSSAASLLKKKKKKSKPPPPTSSSAAAKALWPSLLDSSKGDDKSLSKPTVFPRSQRPVMKLKSVLGKKRGKTHSAALIVGSTQSGPAAQPSLVGVLDISNSESSKKKSKSSSKKKKQELSSDGVSIGVERMDDQALVAPKDPNVSSVIDLGVSAPYVPPVKDTSDILPDKPVLIGEEMMMPHQRSGTFVSSNPWAAGGSGSSGAGIKGKSEDLGAIMEADSKAIHKHNQKKLSKKQKKQQKKEMEMERAASIASSLSSKTSTGSKSAKKQKKSKNTANTSTQSSMISSPALGIPASTAIQMKKEQSRFHKNDKAALSELAKALKQINEVQPGSEHMKKYQFLKQMFISLFAKLQSASLTKKKLLSDESPKESYAPLHCLDTGFRHLVFALVHDASLVHSPIELRSLIKVKSGGIFLPRPVFVWQLGGIAMLLSAARLSRLPGVSIKSAQMIESMASAVGRDSDPNRMPTMVKECVNKLGFDECYSLSLYAWFVVCDRLPPAPFALTKPLITKIRGNPALPAPVIPVTVSMAGKKTGTQKGGKKTAVSQSQRKSAVVKKPVSLKPKPSAMESSASLAARKVSGATQKGTQKADDLFAGPALGEGPPSRQRRKGGKKGKKGRGKGEMLFTIGI